MRIELTVRGSGASHDVALDGPGHDTLHTALAELATCAGAGQHDRPWLAGQPLRSDQTLVSSGLRDGAVVEFAAMPAPRPREGLWSVQVIAGGSPRQPTLLSRAGITVGRDPGNDIVLADDEVSRCHVRIDVGPRAVTVRDCGSTNGTAADGVPITAQPVDVDADTLLRMGDSVVAVRSGRAAPSEVARPDAVVVDDAEPDSRARPGRVQWLAVLLPAVAGGLCALVTGSPLFLLLAVVSPLLMLGGALGERMQWRRARRHDSAELRRRRTAVAMRVSDELHAETAARRARLPDVATVLDTTLRSGRPSWPPGRQDDGLVVRVGTADLPATTRLRTGADEVSAGTVPCVPQPLDLRAGPVGLAGPAETVRGTARWLVVQLAALHPPSELSLLVVPGAAETAWRWCRWLPHLHAAPASARTAAAILTVLIERGRQQRAHHGHEDTRRTVIVVDGTGGDDPDYGRLATLLDQAATCGVTGVWVAASGDALPAICRTTVLPDDTSACRLILNGSDGRRTVLAEQVSESDAEQVARALASLTDPRGATGLPMQCRLGELLPEADSVHTVRATWAAADGGAGVPIGAGADGPVWIDLARDGPHMLVAGTTGAGKSELLRSIVLGLAFGHAPDDLRFLLVDYKGGAAFADAARLPHTDGVVTDLDAVLASRALRSLGAELRRRESLFAEAGAADIAAYRRQRHGRARVPRLVIVVDEFAELAAEQPAFISGLVGVARRGRSLGVHLVMATQRPGAAVSPEIRANTALRIALRVVEPVESVDVIGVADAAGIAPQQPGRCYVRVGDSVTPMQAARVVADHRSDRTRVELLGPWREAAASTRPAVDNELTRMVDLLGRAAEGIVTPAPPWLPPLPRTVSLAELDTRLDTYANTRIDTRTGPAVGRLDLPDAQAQPTLRLPAHGGTVIVGRARSGRTSALVTVALSMASSLSPARLHLHLIDCDGTLGRALADLPHLGSAAGARIEPELVPRLLLRLAASGPSAGAERTVLLVDDWDAVLAERSDGDAARWSDLMSGLLRTAGDDLLVVVTGGRSLLMPRTLAGFGTRLVLALDDAADYGMAGIGATTTPVIGPETPPGSGVRAADGAAFQLARVGDERVVASHVAAVATGFATAKSTAIRLRPLPEQVGLTALRRRSGSLPALLLGVAGDFAEPCALDLVPTGGRLLVAGPARSGRTTTLSTLVHEAVRLGHEVALWAPRSSSLSACAHTLPRVRAIAAGMPPPDRPTLVVVDDVERCNDVTSETVAHWLRRDDLPLAAVVAGRSDELATSYHELAAVVRREQCGLLLRPRPLDGDLLGVRLGPTERAGPPGRGVLIADPRWLVAHSARSAVMTHDPLPVQVAMPS